MGIIFQVVMRNLILSILAGLLVAGCATDHPSPLSSSGPSQPPSATKPGSGVNNHSFGHAKPLKRDQIQIIHSSIGGGSGAGPSGNEQPPPRSIKKNASPAVMSLVNSADKAIKQQKAARAGGLIQNALHLAPRNPFLYQKLAAIRLAQDRPDEAIQLARKSNSLAGNNPFIKQANWKLIAKADKKQGHKSAVQEANLRAHKYKRIAKQY